MTPPSPPRCETVGHVVMDSGDRSRLLRIDELLNSQKDKGVLEAGGATQCQAAHCVAFKYEVEKAHLFVIPLC